MSRLLVLPLVLTLAGAAAQVLLRRRVIIQRVITFAGIAGILVFGIALTASVVRGVPVATQVGGWPPGFAIAFVADVFSALMLVVASLMMLVCAAFACVTRDDHRPFFHPLLLILAAGTSGAFLTADLFNLFVFFEVMLIASYALLVLDASREQIRAGAVYVGTNLLASTVLVAGVATIYGTTGTVNLGELAGAARSYGEVFVAGTLLLVAFSVKSSLVPVHGWLPRSYPAALPSVTALFSGLLTKAGVYALFRIYTLLFGSEGSLGAVLLVVASVTMVVGVLGAVGRYGMRDILSFHMVSQVGYMVAGLALLVPLGLAAGIFYILHHINVKTSLLLSAGATEKLTGTGDIRRLKGMASRHPVLASSFMLGALSLAGLPPLSGFFAKLTIVQAAFTVEQYAVATVAIAVSILTLMSMIKIWNGAFWGDDRGDSHGGGSVGEARGAVLAAAGPAAQSNRLARAALIAPGFSLALLSLLLGLWPDGLLDLSARAAADLLDPSAYVEAVTGR